MTDHKSRVRPDWATALRTLLDRASKAGPKGLMVFDLDSTIFDNRPRQSRIVREFGKSKGIAALATCDVSHWNSGWDLKAAMIACGMSPDAASGLYNEAKKFWADRFFTSEYAVDDVEVPGAPQYLHQVLKTGAQLIYCTGRHEEMRAGSEKCLAKCGMPVPNKHVQLLMKPTRFEDDDEYKRVTHSRLHKLGEVVGAFDNEPTHANDYARSFPNATVIHLATDHSGRPVDLLPEVISVPDFRI